MCAEKLLKILMELPPKDQATMIFCNTLGACRALESWLTSVPEAMDVIGGADKMKPVHRGIPKEVSWCIYCVLAFD